MNSIATLGILAQQSFVYVASCGAGASSVAVGTGTPNLTSLKSRNIMTRRSLHQHRCFSSQRALGVNARRSPALDTQGGRRKYRLEAGNEEGNCPLQIIAFTIMPEEAVQPAQATSQDQYATRMRSCLRIDRRGLQDDGRSRQEGWRTERNALGLRVAALRVGLILASMNRTRSH